MMLMAAYASSAGGIGTPVGTPPNLIGISLIEKFTEVKIPFFQWMLFAVPLLVVMYVVLFGLIYLLHKPEEREVPGGREFVRAELAKLGAWTRGQKFALLAFSVAVTLWIAPGFIALISGSRSAAAQTYNARVPEAAAALIAALLLFVLPVDWKKKEFAISWRQAVRIDWGVLLLYGGGMALGDLMIQTKLADAVGPEPARPERGDVDVGHHPGGHLHRRPGERGHVQHGLGQHGRPGHHLPGPGRGRQSPAAGHRGHARGELGLHAARLDGAERHRLRLRPGPHHQDDPGRRPLRPARRPDHLARPAIPAAGRAGLSGGGPSPV